MEEQNNEVLQIEETNENLGQFEMKISEIKKTDIVTFNYEELKEKITERANHYKNLVYTEENCGQAKEDRALLNKVSKAINDNRKNAEKEVMAPFEPFKKQCNELIAIIDDASKSIDVQVKEFEQKEKDDKMVQILMYWSENSGEYGAIIDTDKLIKKEWLNKSYSMTKIQQEIIHIVNKTRTDMAVIDTTVKDEQLNKQTKVKYFDNIGEPTNLSIAIQFANDMKEKTELLEKNNNENIAEKSKEKELEVTEEIIQFDFRVWATRPQLLDLQQYLKDHNIKIGKVK